MRGYLPLYLPLCCLLCPLLAGSPLLLRSADSAGYPPAFGYAPIIFVLHSLEIMRPLLSTQALASAEYAAWSAHVQYFTAMMASTFTDASIAALDGMIFRAQELFLAIEAYSSLWKPKNHFAQHIPNDIKTFGPPRTYWCMRFEAKNQEHKRAGKMSNFRDVPKTVAFFWERRSGFRLLKKRKYDEYMTHAVAVAPYGSVMVDGWLHLSPGTWVSMPLSEQSQPSLSQIRGISWAKDECYLHVRSYPLSYICSISTTGQDGVSYTPTAGLESGYQEITVSLPSTATAVKRILASQFGGAVYWVVQP